jgi:hypothetical protein
MTKIKLTDLVNIIKEEAAKAGPLYNVYRAEIDDPETGETYYYFGYSDMSSPRTNNAGYWWTYNAKQAKVLQGKGQDTPFIRMMEKLKFDSRAGYGEELGAELSYQEAMDLINKEIKNIDPKYVLNVRGRGDTKKVPKGATKEINGELYINIDKMKDYLKDVTFEDSNLPKLSKDALTTKKFVEIPGQGKYYKSTLKAYNRV